ncbi:NAD(P)-binding domain-containing protein [Constantimarinum furrinae]|uniref:Pyridine nucleotide-disulfide oxidoreductase n=1 Tax=Constantimarinum furrinae TaxID=2562285 RepID=A0A7G8PQK3_9FLAO|nr:NAD(P)-binding domain-containing protein [Constantimarinum furrinae]QNJ96619.1 Pyridine nucleotide-disulfide oxidoreductase [Constantimarinum furrinae]
MSDIFLEQLITYGIVFIFCAAILFLYLRKKNKATQQTIKKVEIAKEEGLHEPVSLHPYIDPNACIGSGACVKACPEQDILGMVNGQASVINASNCVGHGACFHACPVEAITLRIGTESRGVDLPHVNQNFETNMKGIYIAGELGGMGLIKNSVEQGQQAIESIVKSKKPNPNKLTDVIIIGAGPAGISATLAAKKHKLTSKTLEQDSLGGTVFTFPRSKVVMTSPMNLPLHGKVKLHDTSKQELLELWQKVISENKIEIQENTKVENITPQKDGSFKLTTANGQEHFANNVLIAIGRRGSPRKLGIPGEDSEKVAYRMLEPELIEDKDIIVVGGGDSAMEAAMLMMDKNRVKILVRSDNFTRSKPKNRENITKAAEEAKLEIIYNSSLISISDESCIFKITDEEDAHQVKNDLVYIFAGGLLPTAFLEKAGVEITKRFGYIMKKH